MKDFFEKAASGVGNIIDDTKKQLSSTLNEKNRQKVFSNIERQTKRGAAALSEGYENSGAKDAMERAGNKLDEMSGKTILEEMREAFKIQAIYNDTLATKLQEALDRIADLEARARKP